VYEIKTKQLRGWKVGYVPEPGFLKRQNKPIIIQILRPINL
jgi:hypothetical protein